MSTGAGVVHNLTPQLVRAFLVLAILEKYFRPVRSRQAHYRLFQIEGLFLQG